MSSSVIVVSRLCCSREYVAFEFFGLPDEAFCIIHGFLDDDVCGGDQVILHRLPAGMMALVKVFRMIVPILHYQPQPRKPIYHYQGVIYYLRH